MNYQVLDVKVKDTEETAKLYTYFLDNSREIAPERVRPVIVICPGGGYEFCSIREGAPVARAFARDGIESFVLEYDCAPAPLGAMPVRTAAAAVSNSQPLKEKQKNRNTLE